jgi:hypothetical protein
LKLDADVSAVVTVKGNGLFIDLQPATKFGEAIIDELHTRSLFAPCPSGECSFIEHEKTCMWCGKTRGG